MMRWLWKKRAGRKAQPAVASNGALESRFMQLGREPMKRQSW
jgi:hypothetical protein